MPRRGTRTHPRRAARRARPRACKSMPPGPLTSGEERLRRQRVELRRVGRPASRVASCRRRGWASTPSSVSSSTLLGRLARLRLLRDPLLAPLDVVAVGDEQLEPRGSRGRPRGRPLREAVEHGQDRVHLAEVPEQLGPRAGDVDDTDRCRRDLLRLNDRRKQVEPVVGDRRHADVRLVGHRRVRRDLRARVGQRVEQRGLAAVR